MEADEIRKLITFFEGTNLTYFEIVDNNRKITFSKASNMIGNGNALMLNDGQVYSAKTVGNTKLDIDSGTATTNENIYIIKSPYVGVITLSDILRQSDGEIVVNSGDVVCSIEAMKLYNEITAPVSGIVTEILVEEASLVEYNQPIIKILMPKD